MIILNLTESGAIRLPKETLRHLGNPQHLQVRQNATGITLTPVRIMSTMDRKGIPPEPPRIK